MGQPRGFVFIVDPGSSGNQLAPVYLEDGIYPIFVRSDAQYTSRFLSGLKPQDFMEDKIPAHVHNALLSGNQKRIEKAASELIPLLKAEHGRDIPIYVIAGNEAGVPAAERLAVSQGLETYDKNFIRAHHSKPHMQWAISDAGIQVIPYTTVRTPEQAIRWIRRELQGMEHVGGVVVKSGLGHSGAQVIPCRTEAEVEAAVRAVLAEKSISGTANHSVMIQPFIKGREFAVNSVSVLHEGKFYSVITDVWEYIKPAPPAYAYEKLMKPEDIPAGLLEKHMAVQNAMHYRDGAAHAEYFVVSDATMSTLETLGLKREHPAKDAGLVLNGEIAHRLYGGGDTDIGAASTNYGQIRGLVDTSINKEEVIRRAKAWEETGIPYSLTHLSLVFNVNAPTADRPMYANGEIWNQLRREFGDNIFKMNVFFPEDGTLLNPTRNLSDTMAQIKFRVPIGEGDEAALLKMVARVQELEATGAFWRDTKEKR